MFIVKKSEDTKDIDIRYVSKGNDFIASRNILVAYISFDEKEMYVTKDDELSNKLLLNELKHEHESEVNAYGYLFKIDKQGILSINNVQVFDCLLLAPLRISLKDYQKLKEFNLMYINNDNIRMYIN